MCNRKKQNNIFNRVNKSLATVFKMCLVCCQGDLSNVDTAGVVTPRLNEGESVGTDTPTSIPMATPQVLGECQLYLKCGVYSVCPVTCCKTSAAGFSHSDHAYRKVTKYIKVCTDTAATF